MLNKYSIDSDFIQSYLNLFVVSKFFNGNFSLENDARTFNSCVHLNASAYNLSNCSDRRDRVESFISSNEEVFNKYRTVAVESCKTELLTAHNLDAQMEKDQRKVSPSELNFLTLKKLEAEEALNNCVKNNLS